MKTHLPLINASLNLIVAILLVWARFAIAKGNEELHKTLMKITLLVSTVFLGCYIYFHFFCEQVPFGGVGAIRTVYFSILFSHTFLAMVVLPMIFVTVFWAVKGMRLKHRKLAPWTWAIWFYVAITGVLTFLIKLPYYPRL